MILQPQSEFHPKLRNVSGVPEHYFPVNAVSLWSLSKNEFVGVASCRNSSTLITSYPIAEERGVDEKGKERSR